jgi:GR25 family glycosyltransferase involved in LPS biosynthesis
MDNASIIPKFIICKNNTNIDNLHITNYFRINEYDSSKNDINYILSLNKLYITKDFIENYTVNDLNRFLTHYFIWKFISENSLDYSIIIEDNIRIFTSFNKNINAIFNNIPEVFDYIGLYINNKDLEQSNGELKIQKKLHEPNAYILTLNGAKRLLKLTKLWKINRSIDKQIYSYIQQKFLRGYIIKKQFLYSNNIKYKHTQITGINNDLIKIDGLTVNDVEVIENELIKYKKEVKCIVEDKSVNKEELVEKSVNEEELVEESVNDKYLNEEELVEELVEESVNEEELVEESVKDKYLNEEELVEESVEDKYISNIVNKLNLIFKL